MLVHEDGVSHRVAGNTIDLRCLVSGRTVTLFAVKRFTVKVGLMLRKAEGSGRIMGENVATYQCELRLVSFVLGVATLAPFAISQLAVQTVVRRPLPGDIRMAALAPFGRDPLPGSVALLALSGKGCMAGITIQRPTTGLRIERSRTKGCGATQVNHDRQNNR
jgi:hypothetical protein